VSQLRFGVSGPRFCAPLRIDAEDGDLVMIEVWELMVGVLVAVGLGVWACRSAGLRRRDRRICGEFEAYARLDVRVERDGGVREFGEWVCGVVAEVSGFEGVAMLAEGGDGRLGVVASLGLDGGVVAAMNDWGGRVFVVRGGAEVPVGRVGVMAGMGRFGVGEGVVVPMWAGGRKMLGALVVWGEGEMVPLEGLAERLALTMENAALEERLVRQERLASLGEVAGGVAHGLSDPLTAVLGFAELIAESAVEVSVQRDAERIVREAVRMQETVQRLVSYWRPAVVEDEPVLVVELLRELAAECEGALAGRGVRLVVEMAEDAPVVRGSRDRLRQVMEHLLNYSARAVGDASGGDGEHVIRVSLTHDGVEVQVMVSDTGPGFREPGRVFDGYYAMRELGEDAGLGLSICQGIVREHGGEISVFNLHPRGAAVVVELPVG
jgi:signal transduction histidine kinase